MSEAEARTLLHDWRTWARPEQIAPGGDWRLWLMLCGRGWGKTLALMQWALEQAALMPGSRGAVVGATAADARDVLVEGESGILNAAPPRMRPRYLPSKRRLVFPNGTTALVFSADEPNRLRGVQHHWAVADEIAAWRYESAFDMLLMGLRLGENPRCAVATTPRPTPLIRRLLSDPTCVTVRGSTFENAAHLAPPFLQAILRRYEGTRLGRQELYAEVLDDAPGALFQREWIDIGRVARPPKLRRVVVAVDPAVSSGEDADETGIIAAGVGADGHGYVLDDASLVGTPAAWAAAAVTLARKHDAGSVIAEANNGGEMVAHTLKLSDPAAVVRLVRASRGKAARAEPIAALYEQGRVHHVGGLAALEDQMCAWTPTAGDSPDRLDALVWALWALMVEPVDDEIVIRGGRVKCLTTENAEKTEDTAKR